MKDGSVQAQLLKKEQEIQSKEAASMKSFNDYKQRRYDIWLTRPVDSFALALANLLELSDEEAKLVDSKLKSVGDLKDSPFQKGLTPSAILQTPLTFSNASKTPGSTTAKGASTVAATTSSAYLTSPKQSPVSKDDPLSRWRPKVSRDAIVSVFKESSEIKRLMFNCISGLSTKSTLVIPTPPPDLKRKCAADCDTKQTVDDGKVLKFVRLDDDNNFYDDQGNKLDSEVMWNDFNYWTTHLQTGDLE